MTGDNEATPGALRRQLEGSRRMLTKATRELGKAWRRVDSLETVLRAVLDGEPWAPRAAEDLLRDEDVTGESDG